MDKEKHFMFHTTKTRVTLVIMGLMFFSFLTYLFLIKIIDNTAWSGLIALDLFLVILTTAIIDRRKSRTCLEKF